MSADFEPNIHKVLENDHAIAMASGILMELDRSTSPEAQMRLGRLATRFHLTMPEMASVLIESHS